MKISALILGGFMMAATALPGANLVKNGNFTELNNRYLPVGWDVRKSAGASAGVNLGEFKLQVSDPAQVALALQRNLPLESGKSYVVSCEVKGSDGAEYMLYMESTVTNNGKSKLTSAHTQKLRAANEFKVVRFVYDVPANSKAPYVVLRACKGEVSFRNLVIEDLAGKTPADSLIKNGSFDLVAGSAPQFWEMRGNGYSVESGSEGNFLRLPGGTLALQKKLPLQAGKRYTMSALVRSSDADNQLVIYFEWSDGKKLRSRISPPKTANSEWSKVELELAFPDNGRNAYVVLRSVKGTVDFRDVAVVEVK